MNEDREWTLNNVEQICVDTKDVDEICFGLEQLTIFATENIQNFATTILKLNIENQQLKSTLEEIREYVKELDDETDNIIYEIAKKVRNDLLQIIDKGVNNE